MSLLEQLRNTPVAFTDHSELDLVKRKYDWVDYAEARTNTLRLFLTEGDTQFGGKVLRAMDDPELAHHGHHHSRHVEKAGEWALRIMLEEGKFDKDDPGLFEDMTAFSMFHYFHDLDQQMTALYNLDNPDAHLKEKKGHGVAAAVMALAMKQDLAAATNMDTNQAQQITSSAAIMMMRHDIPEQFDKTFNPENEKAYLLSEEELYGKFYKDTIDIYSLSPAQLIDILRRTKEDAENMIPGSVYGLDPDFEQEHAAVLKSLALDTQPLFDNSLYGYQEQRERITHLSEIAYWADMTDMICPYTDQITRTLQTQYSRERPFSTFADTETSVQEAFDNVMGPEGNGLTGDDERILWELVNFGHVSKNSFLKGNKEIDTFTREHVMLSAMAFKYFGEMAIMGRVDEAIEQLYASRLLSYEEKKNRRLKQFPEAEEEIKLQYNTRKREIEEEMKTLIQSFTENKSEQYITEDLNKFTSLADKVIAELRDRYKVTDGEYEAWQAIVADFSTPPTQFFSSSDSLRVREIKHIDQGGNIQI